MSSGKPYLMSSSFSNLSRPMKMVKSPTSGRALKQNTIFFLLLCERLWKPTDATTQSCEELGLRSTFKLSKTDFATSSFHFYYLFSFFVFFIVWAWVSELVSDSQLLTRLQLAQKVPHSLDISTTCRNLTKATTHLIIQIPIGLLFCSRFTPLETNFEPYVIASN